MRKFALFLLRALLLDLPLALLFLVYLLSLSARYVHDEYLTVLRDAVRFKDTERTTTEQVYYKRICDGDDVSTSKLDDLMIQEDWTSEEAVENVHTHGLSIFPELVSRETTAELREYMLKRIPSLGKNEKHILIEGTNRWSWNINANDDPAVAKALKEVGNHPLFRDTLEKLLGRNPAVLEICTITAAFGAKGQYYHSDTIETANSLLYGQTFTPLYTLFIPLQDTTAEMGATSVCPGTHHCYKMQQGVCDKHGFQVANATSSTPFWPAGYGALANMQTYHRGAEHSQKFGPTRTTLILTFLPRPALAETRIPSLGTLWAIPYNMWGHTLNDLARADVVMTQPWATLRALGLYKLPNTEWGWDFITTLLIRITNNDNGMENDDLDFLIENGGHPTLGFANLDKFPSWLTGDKPENKAKNNWISFILDTVDKMIYWSLIANAVAVGSYLMCVTLGAVVRWESQYGTPAATAPPKSPWTFRRVFLRLIITHGSIALFVAIALKCIDSTAWARNLKSGALFHPSFPETHISKLDENVFYSYVDEVVAPRRNDVLVGKLLRTEHDRHFLSHHAGTFAWMNRAKSAVPTYIAYRGLPAVFQTVLLNSIMHDSVLDKGGRFLVESVYGDWRIMQAGEARRATRIEITRQSSRLYKLLSGALLQLNAEAKHSPLRKTAMMRKNRIEFLESWENVIYSGEKATESGKSDNKLRIGSNSYPKKPELFASSLARDMISEHCKSCNHLGKKQSSYQEYLYQQPGRHNYFELYQSVEVWEGGPSSTRWIPGTISGYSYQTGLYNVLLYSGETYQNIMVYDIRGLEEQRFVLDEGLFEQGELHKQFSVPLASSSSNEIFADDSNNATKGESNFGTYGSSYGDYGHVQYGQYPDHGHPSHDYQAEYGSSQQYPEYGYGYEPEYEQYADYGYQAQYGHESQYANPSQQEEYADYGYQAQYGHASQYGQYPDYGHQAQYGHESQYAQYEQYSAQTYQAQYGHESHYTYSS